MKSIITLLLIITSTLSSLVFTPLEVSFTSSNSLTTMVSNFLPRKDRFWNDENMNLLTPEQRNQITPIKEKLSKGEGLTAEEAEINITLKEAVVKIKLGEEDYQKYKNLIEKRKSGMELTPEDKSKLYEIRKKLKPYNCNTDKTKEQKDEKPIENPQSGESNSSNKNN